MILDSSLIICDAQEETTVDTHSSDYVLDLGADGDAYNELYCVIRVATTCTSDGSATVQFKIHTSDAEAMSSDTDLYTSSAIAVATLVAGYTVTSFRLPKRDQLKQYLAAEIIIAEAALTAGAFDIFLTDIDHTNL
jgi:hypothetical protein